MQLNKQNPVMIAVPETTRSVFNQIAEVTGKPQHQVVSEAAARELKRVQRQQKGGQAK